MQIPNSTLCQSGNLFTRIQSKLLEKLNSFKNNMAYLEYTQMQKFIHVF